MLLNLRQIEVFRAIMLTGSISKAAQLLNVSQPAISRLLSYTESRIGLVLFERIKGRLYPTPEARRLYQVVEQVHNSVQRVNEVATDLIEKRHGSLHIAVSPSLGQTLIPMAAPLIRWVQGSATPCSGQAGFAAPAARETPTRVPPASDPAST